MELSLIKKAVAWCLLAVTLLFLLTGFGISNSSLVTPLTLGVMGKAVSFKIHEVIWIPFALFLAAHLLLNYAVRRPKK